jgi:hypothetical protein
MIITSTVTKKILENIVHQTFSNFGMISSSALLDSLKFLGFYYATNAGISINIEDLKTPQIKKDFLDAANEEMRYVSEQWQRGSVSDTERFQTIIDSWNFATESLKDRIVEYYQNFDPANNLYIMAFSGARGNMSQVRQLVGMRGLMSDQEGRIIDLPIQTNFREGLSSIDYIISSYGARKGIVDTALKTADSGYLTRRLIYIAQDLIIREIDCKTTIGVLVIFQSKTNLKNIIGRTLISAKSLKTSRFVMQNILLNEENLGILKQQIPLKLKLRSPITCNASGSICQKCYGWDLAQNKLISLGEAVGIIAAQSIGEPGTQLTMRTFHTGGIFTSELVEQIRAPFSGKITIPNTLKVSLCRTTHGTIVSKLQQEITLKIINWRGITEEIFLEIGSLLYIRKSGFIQYNQLISEYSNQSFLASQRRLKPIYPTFEGEIHFENLCVRSIPRDEKPTVKVNYDDGVLWLKSGQILSLPREAKFECKEYLTKTKACVKIALVSPHSGIVTYEKNKLSIINLHKKKEIDLNYLPPLFVKKKLLADLPYEEKFSVLVKNYQYIDAFTTLGFIHMFPRKGAGKIYSLRRRNYAKCQVLLLVTESDIWKVNSEQIDHFPALPKKKGIIAGTKLNETLKLSQSGYFLKKDGFQMIFQNALPIFVSKGTILNYSHGDFIDKNSVLATLVNYTQQTEDIVQGLPKVEELIEARCPKENVAILADAPGIFLKDKEIRHDLAETILGKESLTTYVYRPAPLRNQYSAKMRKKWQFIRVLQAPYSESASSQAPSRFCFYDGKLCEPTLLPKGFVAERTSKNGKEYWFRLYEGINPEDGKTVLLGDTFLHETVNAKKIAKKWTRVENEINNPSNRYLLRKDKNEKWVEWEERNVNRSTYHNPTGDMMVWTKQQRYIFLRVVNPIKEYKVHWTQKSLAQPGYFIDLGEPITEGVIDPNALLYIFFKYHNDREGIRKGTLKSVNKFQLLVVNSIQAIYQSQDVNIASKHIEIIVRQMTSHVKVFKSGDTPLIIGEIVRLSLLLEISKVMEANSVKQTGPEYIPMFRSTTATSLNKDGFMSAAGFQQTKKVLSRAAIEGTSDWLRGLKECVIIGRLIPAGSAFLNYKKSLDHVYFYTNESDKYPRF